ncbi:hypothetical protein ABVF61_19280 [Roseibium sp. HPY-6]|uniref:hypothetical protein n=1 Tax=Roseibium sp. HPY-6 TaxID=3229852 RepID=UPI00338D6EAD
MACRSTEDTISSNVSRKTCNGDCANCGAVESMLNQLEISLEEGLASTLQQQPPKQTGPQTVGS